MPNLIKNREICNNFYRIFKDNFWFKDFIPWICQNWWQKLHELVIASFISEWFLIAVTQRLPLLICALYAPISRHRPWMSKLRPIPRDSLISVKVIENDLQRKSRISIVLNCWGIKTKDIHLFLLHLNVLIILCVG